MVFRSVRTSRSFSSLRRGRGEGGRCGVLSDEDCEKQSKASMLQH